MEKDELSLEELDQIRAGNFSSAVGESAFNDVFNTRIEQKIDQVWEQLMKNTTPEEREMILEGLNQKIEESKTTGMSR